MAAGLEHGEVICALLSALGTRAEVAQAQERKADNRAATQENYSAKERQSGARPNQLVRGGIRQEKKRRSHSSSPKLQNPAEPHFRCKRHIGSAFILSDSCKKIKYFVGSGQITAQIP